MNLLIIGFFEFLCLYLGLTYLSAKKFIIRDFLYHLIVVLIPVILSYIYTSRIFSISIFLILTGFLFIKHFKRGMLIINFSILIIIGIFTDGILHYLEVWFQINNSNLVFHILLFVLLFFLQVFLYKSIIKFDIRKSEIISKNVFFIGIILFTTVVVFYINIFKFNLNEFLVFNLIWQSIYIILIISMLWLFNYNNKKEYEFKKKEIMQKNFSEYTNKLAEVNMEMQKFRHDYLNILSTMQQYIEDEDLGKLKEFFHNNILALESQTLFRNKLIGTLENIKILEIKSILVSKIIQAGNLDIELSIEIPSEINNVYVDTIDLARVLGIYLDNAIEASLKVSNPKINLAFLQLGDNQLLFIIENRYDGKKMDLNSIHQIGVSHKKESYGLGLANSKEILSKYNNVVTNTRVEAGWFIQEVQIGGI